MEELVAVSGYVVFYRVYAINVVLNFYTEIKHFRGLNQTLSNLSDKEVEEFLYETIDEKSFSEQQKRCNYKNHYEISLDNLEFGKSIHINI